MILIFTTVFVRDCRPDTIICAVTNCPSDVFAVDISPFPIMTPEEELARRQFWKRARTVTLAALSVMGALLVLDFLLK